MARRPSLQTLEVLRVMLEDVTREYYGVELTNVAGLPSGTIYPILARLERQKWLSSRWEEIDPSVVGRPRKRLYTLTGSGARQAREHLTQAQKRLGVSPINPPQAASPNPSGM